MPGLPDALVIGRHGLFRHPMTAHGKTAAQRITNPAGSVAMFWAHIVPP